MILTLLFSIFASVNSHASLWVEVEEYKPEIAVPERHIFVVHETQDKNYLLNFAKGIVPKKLLNIKNGALSFSSIEKGSCADTPVELCMAKIVKVYRCPDTNRADESKKDHLGSCKPVRGLYQGRSPG